MPLFDANGSPVPPAAPPAAPAPSSGARELVFAAVGALDPSRPYAQVSALVDALGGVPLHEIPSRVAGLLGAFGPGAAAAAGPERDAGGKYAPVARASTAPSNTGAPQSYQGGMTLDANPLRWPAAVVDQMSPQEFRKALQDYDLASGRGNPFRQLRISTETGRRR